jgi:hypothetical protein
VAGGAVYNYAAGNDIGTGSAANAVLTLDNDILSNTSGGDDLTSTASSLKFTDVATVTGGTNLVQTPASGLSLPVGVVTVSSNPNLGPLANNGGLTATMALSSSSSAFGAGNALLPGVPSTDQRGLARVVSGRLDLGAYENQSVPSQPTNTSALASGGTYNATIGTPISAQATVTSNGAPVTEGTVSFAINGTSIGSAPVNNQGVAGIIATLPASFTPGTYTVIASYTDSANPPKFGSSMGNAFLTISPSTTNGGGGGGGLVFDHMQHLPPPTLQKPFLLSLFDQLLGGVELINANGTETVVDNFFGIPLISTYDASGNLVSVTMFGLNLTFLFAL